ncbi:uncharacterized protein F5891DRAFT_669156 [Suillus fuscotomentosus]|uniref:Uncharacterized protein n=1 Tax=Suillus fuscotomentosus TaxID=1912939 RepID=A0AAD4DX45_9AGAM|nr:uncharacterized protein F5891DRAFT_669156 [Suillus fuscotomentosus]KAG1895490.1 hypothetical protein F5891DRAFT_669156 [Suillus fuscotomentosus]
MMDHPTALFVDAGIQASKSEWVWHRRWTFVRFVFTVSRYLPFFGIGMTFTGALRTQYYPGESCVRFGQASTVLHTICILAAEGLLITRVYASWRSKRLLTFLIVFPVICFVVSYIMSDTSLVFNSKNTTSLDIPNPGNCLFVGGRNNICDYAVLLLYELVLFCLMLYIRFSKYGNVVGLLQRTFFNDSVTYMICMIIVSSFNIILTMAPPVTWIAITDSPQIVIHSVLASRILFNLRASEGQSHIHTLTDISELQFGEGQISTVEHGV